MRHLHGLGRYGPKPHLLVEHLEMTPRHSGFDNNIKPHWLQQKLRQLPHVISTILLLHFGLSPTFELHIWHLLFLQVSSGFFPMGNPWTQLDYGGWALWGLSCQEYSHSSLAVRQEFVTRHSCATAFLQVSEWLLLRGKICLFPAASARLALHQWFHCLSASHTVLTRTHLPGMLNVPVMASVKCWLKVTPTGLHIFSISNHEQNERLLRMGCE